jgi:hypothetical protein
MVLLTVQGHQLAYKGGAAWSLPLARPKVLQDHQDQPVHKEAPVSKGLQAHRV